MSDAYTGEIRMFGFHFAPLGWAFCDGSLISISQYGALFQLLGTAYGGDGVNTFALPDLRGRVPVHQGQGPGLSNYVMGQQSGAEYVTLTAMQIPSHTHAVFAAANGTRTTVPANNCLASGEADIFNHDAATPPVELFGEMQASGGSQPHNNMQPVQCVNFCIALSGSIYPSQN